MDSLLARFAAGQTFAEHQATSAHPNLVAVAQRIRDRATVPDAIAARIAATGRRWHLLALSADWCADAVSVLPWAEALAAAAPTVALRILERDAHLDLMDAHLTNGRSRSIPIVIVLDEAGVERGWWGPRPSVLQAWVMSPEAQALSKEDRFAEQRRWYTADQGRAVLEELTALIERAAAAMGSPAPHSSPSVSPGA